MEELLEKKNSLEESFVMIKPDGFEKRVFKEVMERFLQEGLSIKDINITKLDEMLVNEHYSHLLERDFYPVLKSFMTSGPVITMTVFGVNAILKVRDIIGATNPNNAKEGTIRAMYGNKVNTTYNVIHASDSVENGQIEIKRFADYQKRLVK